MKDGGIQEVLYAKRLRHLPLFLCLLAAAQETGLTYYNHRLDVMKVTRAVFLYVDMHRFQRQACPVYLH